MKNNGAYDANHAARLIEFASTLTPAAIPQAAYANAKRCLLDAIGCGLFGASQPWSVLMAAQMFAEKSQGASSVFGHAAPLAACAAALCNGTAIHGFELDDLLPAAIIHPGMVKRMHAGWAASSGVRAALLARDGFTGPSGAVDGRYGLLEVFGGAAAHPASLTQGLGDSWAINAVWFKVYPICGWIQGVVQLLGAMRSDIGGSQPLAGNQIKRVIVGTSRFAVNSNSNATPADTMDAQYSIPYCAALALTRDPGDPRAFEPAGYNNPELLSLAARVKTCVDEACEAVYPQRFGSRVQLLLASGEVKEALTLDPHGTPADPCSDDELAAKFSRLAALSPLKVDSAAIARAVGQLDTSASLRELSQRLRAA